MTSLVRWDPFAELDEMRRRMDRMVGEFRPHRLLSDIGTEFGYFPVDISETEDAFEVEAALPGVKREEIDVHAHGDTITIKGEAKEEAEEKGRDWLRRERRYGAFARSFTLPTGIDPDKATADFDDGILRLHLPKSEVLKPKTIKVDRRRAIEGKKS